MTKEETTEENKSEEATLNGEETKTYSAEEVEAIKKEMQSNSEKGVQKLMGEKKAFEKAMSQINTVAGEPSKLVDLFDEDEKAAEVLLREFYDGQTIDEFKESINYKVDTTDPKYIEKKVREELSKEEEAKAAEKLNTEISDKKEKFIKEFDLKGKELEEFEAEFEDRKGLKSFSSKSIEKHLASALRDSKPEGLSATEINEKIARATGAGSSGKTKKTSSTGSLVKKNSNFNKNFLKSRGIIS